MPTSDNTFNGLQTTQANQIENHHDDWSHTTKD